jgi:hypothetical protein
MVSTTDVFECWLSQTSSHFQLHAETFGTGGQKRTGNTPETRLD